MKLFSIFWQTTICLFLTQYVVAQEEIALGQWKAYLSFNRAYDVTQSENYIYSAAEAGLVKFGKSDQVIETITKVDGLSATEPRKLAFDAASETLVIAYLNGNIDLMVEGKVVNMPNIFSNSNIIKSKNPNQIRIDNNGFAYITYEFGLVQINLSTFTFGFSLFTDFTIYDFVAFDNKYYFSSEDGIYWADAIQNLNHADLSIWNRFESGWPIDYFSRSINSIGDRIYCDVDGSLFELVNEQPVLIQEAKENYFIRQISSLNNKMAVSFFYDGGGFKIDELFFLGPNGEALGLYQRSACSIVVHGAVEDQSGFVFYADEQLGLKYAETVGGSCLNIEPNGPPNSDAFEVTFRDQEVIVAAGEIGDGGAPVINRQGIYTYKDGDWNQFNHTDGFFGDSVFSYMDVAVGPNQQLAIGTYSRGVIITTPDFTEVELLSNGSSCLDKQFLINPTSITDVTYDDFGNLWISNFRAEFPLKMIDRDGVCHSFPISRNFGTSDLTEITIDDRGYKWIATFDATRAVVVFDDVEDRFVTLSSSNSEIQDNVVRDIKADLDGDIWVGTDRGVVVFECAAAIFTSGCSGRRPIVEVDGVPALLLENERIRAIAIDGANRKWFGTSNGIFVQSPNGEEEVLRFDEQNSPLISNFIRDIAINPTTGEVFISTDKGLMSYRTDATDGGTLHAPESEVFAFPNPVRPGYEGPIAVKGLPRDARVKITDMQGKLIFEGEANGGQAIWSGKDYNGRKASSGVYLVFSTSQTSFEKPDALVSKILIVN